MSSLSTEQRFRTSPRIISTRMGEGTVVIDKMSGECYELNRLGTAIWTSLAAGDSVGAIVAGIAAAHAVPVAQVESDVRELMADLVAHGLVLPVDL